MITLLFIQMIYCNFMMLILLIRWIISYSAKQNLTFYNSLTSLTWSRHVRCTIITCPLTLLMLILNWVKMSKIVSARVYLDVSFRQVHWYLQSWVTYQGESFMGFYILYQFFILNIMTKFCVFFLSHSVHSCMKAW